MYKENSYSAHRMVAYQTFQNDILGKRIDLEPGLIVCLLKVDCRVK